MKKLSLFYLVTLGWNANVYCSFKDPVKLPFPQGSVFNWH